MTIKCEITQADIDLFKHARFSSGINPVTRVLRPFLHPTVALHVRICKDDPSFNCIQVLKYSVHWGEWDVEYSLSLGVDLCSWLDRYAVDDPKDRKVEPLKFEVSIEDEIASPEALEADYLAKANASAGVLPPKDDIYHAVG